MFSQKRLAMLRVAESFGASCPRHRERSGKVAEFQAILKLRATNVLVNKAGIETVSRADRIGHVDYRSKSRVFLLAFPSAGPLRTAFDHQNGDSSRQELRRLFPVIHLR